MSERTTVRIDRWTPGPLPGDVEASLARLAASEDVRHVAVMPDVHLANDVCVGVALATTRLIYPAAVGGDIGCGIAALAFHGDASVLGDEHSAARVLAGLGDRVATNRHRRSAMRHLPEYLDPAALSDDRLCKLATRDGRVQLGTLGRGNHFVELQADETGRLWAMIHSGSRGIGQAITGHHVATADRAATGLAVFEAESIAGRAYLGDVEWGLRYAEANRLAMLRAVATLLGDLFDVTADWSTLIHGHHDHVRREEHFGESFWVHRKGAQRADDGLAGIVPGSMGTCSFHVTGRGHEPSLRSSSHGAGRSLHRSEARRRIGARQFAREMQGIWFDHRLRHRLRDEAPSAYKDVRAVMRAQRALTRIERELRPLLVYKGA